MYDGSENGMEKWNVGMEYEKNKNDIKKGSVTGDPP